MYQRPLPLDDEFAEFKLHVPAENRKKETVIAVKEPAVPVIKEEKSVALPQPKSPEKLEEPTPAPVKPPATVVEKPKKEVFKLNFPDSFSDKLRKLISHHLASLEIPQQAERLLDYFAKCLKNGNIRNPTGYLISLKKRWLAGKLDLSEDHQQAPASSKTEEEKAQQQKKAEQRMAYQKAFADIEQLKKTITNVSNEHDCTFEEAHKRIHFTSIWEKAVACLAQAKEAYSPLVPTLEHGN